MRPGGVEREARRAARARFPDPARLAHRPSAEAEAARVGACVHRVPARDELAFAQRLARSRPPSHGLIYRPRRAAAAVFSRPLPYWTSARLFGLKPGIFTILAPRRF